MIKLGSYCIVGLLAVNLFVSCKQTADKPNVILVISEDQGWGDIGYNGNQMLHTPVLDSLATQSVVLDRFYVSPQSTSSRISILTGRYHLATGISEDTDCKEEWHMSKNTIAKIFKENNYQTAYFGEWHDSIYNPSGYGFDKFFGFCAGNWASCFDTQEQWNQSMVQSQEYSTNLFADSLNHYIHQSQQPYLAVLSYNTSHSPYEVPNQYFNKYVQMGLDKKTAAVYGMIENIDNNINRLLKTLNNKGQIDHTIIIFTSVSGPNFVRYNGGFKGRKGQVDEGSIRVLFMIHYPDGNFKTRHISDGFACHMDLLPTLLELCHIQSNKPFHGRSFSASLLKDKALSSNRMLFSHQALNENGLQSNAVRTNKYLLTCYSEDTALFNLKEDPYQMKNLIKQKPVLADSLLMAYQKWFKEIRQHKSLH